MSADFAMAAQGFGAGMSTVGSYYSALGQKNTLNSQARIDDINSKMADMSAQSALLAGQREEQAVRLNTAKLKATQKTSFAANGIDLGSDSVVSVLTSTDVLGETDANTVAANALRTAFGYQAQSVNYKNKAIGARTSASGISPFASAFGTFATSAGRVADSWYSLKKEGAFDSAPDPLPWQHDGSTKPSWMGGGAYPKDNLVSNALY